MKKIIILLQLFFSFHIVCAQSYNVDSLKELLTTTIDDSTRLENLFQIVVFYIDNNLDSSMKYVKQFNQIPSKPKQMQVNGLNIMGDIYLRLGNASKSLETLLKALKLDEELNDPFGMSMLYWNIGKVYQSQNDNEKAINYYLKSLKISSSSSAELPGIPKSKAMAYLTSSSVQVLKIPKSKALAYLGLVYMNSNHLDSALYYTQSSYMIIRQRENKADLPHIVAQLGNIYQKSGDTNLALNYYRMALKEALPQQNFSALSETYIDIAELLKKNKVTDSCYYYARQGFIIAKQLNNASLVLKASNFLKDFFKDKNKLDSAFKYQEIETAAKDSMLSLEKIKKVQSISFEEQERLQELEAQKKEYQNNIKLYALIISLTVFLFAAIFLYRNNRRKQKVNILLQQQKEEIETQRNSVEKTLQELKSTQAQLIQSEKMASLGELTAGIAHEIQNPLNFVNNFSEVNKEMLEELKAERFKPKAERDEKTEDEILADVIANEEKINHHGKRADAIVKGMLQHSRSSTGVKEPTDINALADEYLRLSFHGLRAKDKDFNVTMKTHFDESIGRINVIPQDIGRVLLNLYNNAFYAVSERQEAEGKEYRPTVSVSTKKSENNVFITVSDNGSGIPEKIKEKIFQPFFTTKPTGEGTGLGLSLSYDIIKAHGGELTVKNREGEGSEFIVWLPMI